MTEEEPAKDTASETDEDEAVVEDVTESDKSPKTKEVTVEEWIHMNSQPPIWMRCEMMPPSPKTIIDATLVGIPRQCQMRSMSISTRQHSKTIRHRLRGTTSPATQAQVYPSKQ